MTNRRTEGQSHDRSSTRLTEQRVPTTLRTIQLEEHIRKLSEPLGSKRIKQNRYTYLAVTPVTKWATLFLRQPTRVEERVALRAAQTAFVPYFPDRALLFREVDCFAAACAERGAWATSRKG